MSALVDALGDPERYGRRFVQQLATGFVPMSGFLRTVSNASDPVVRAPQSITEGVRAIIPGQSGSEMTPDEVNEIRLEHLCHQLNRVQLAEKFGRTRTLRSRREVDGLLSLKLSPP